MKALTVAQVRRQIGVMELASRTFYEVAAARTRTPPRGSSWATWRLSRRTTRRSPTSSTRSRSPRAPARSRTRASGGCSSCRSCSPASPASWTAPSRRWRRSSRRPSRPTAARTPSSSASPPRVGRRDQHGLRRGALRRRGDQRPRPSDDPRRRLRPHDGRRAASGHTLPFMISDFHAGVHDRRRRRPRRACHHFLDTPPLHGHAVPLGRVPGHRRRAARVLRGHADRIVLEMAGGPLENPDLAPVPPRGAPGGSAASPRSGSRCRRASRRTCSPPRSSGAA